MRKKRKILPRDKEFGQRLRKLRKEHGLSQDKLAKKLGYKTSVSISKTESGITPPDIRVLAKIAKVLDADLHWLITGKPSPQVTEFVTLLRPYIEASLAEISEQIRSLDRQGVRLELAHLFRDEENRPAHKKNRQKAEQLKAEYEKIVSVINQASGPKNKVKIGK